MMQAKFDENDDLAVLIDTILNRPGIRLRYNRGDSEDWISLVGDQDMEDGLRALPEMEQQIIEKFFLQGKSLIDISSDLELPMDLLLGHLTAIKVRLEIYV